MTTGRRAKESFLQGRAGEAARVEAYRDKQGRIKVRIRCEVCRRPEAPLWRWDVRSDRGEDALQQWFLHAQAWRHDTPDQHAT